MKIEDLHNSKENVSAAQKDITGQADGKKIKIIADAMGGDNAPLDIIKGTVLAQREYNIDVILTGRQSVIKETASKNGLDISQMEIIHCDDVIGMEDSAGDVVKSKSESSMAVGLKLLKEGKGDAFVSAGNSGALCMGGALIVKRVNGITRPGFAPVLPGLNGCFMLIDSGANVECRPEMLMQFGIMGSIYMEKVMKIKNPRVGLANVGTEAQKGRELQLKTFEILKESNLNFIGNVEGRDIPLNGCDVLVCDGFTGNLITKTYEGVAIALMDKLKTVFMKNIKTKIAAGLIYKDIKLMKREFDYKEYGGAPIMGTLKPIFKSHGSADAVTFKNAVRLTIEYAKSGVISAILDCLK